MAKPPARIWVCLGAGGVGKTTVSAALAVDSALRGASVLCLTIDPARRLADSLGVNAIGGEVYRLSATQWSGAGLDCRGSLDVLMLDGRRTFDGLVEENSESDEIRDRILGNRFYRYIADNLAGTQEYMAIEKLHEVWLSGCWDLIVLDTPPTANAVDFLSAPQRLVAALDSPATHWLMEAFAGAGRHSWRWVSFGTNLVLRGLGRITGVGFLQEMAGFLGAMNQLFGGFRQRAERVASVLGSSSVTYWVVTAPDAASADDSEFLYQKLRHQGSQQMVTVVNRRVLAPEAVEQGGQADADLSGLLVENSERAALYQAMRGAYEDEVREAARQAGIVDKLRRSCGLATSLIEVPDIDSRLEDLAGLAKLGAVLRPPEGAV